MTRITSILATACLACAAAATAAPPADEPLDPDKAFHPEARLVAGDPVATVNTERHGIDIDYRIAPGYYIYRSRLRFEVSPPTLLIGAPDLPPGIEVNDPFIGKSAIYRERVTIHLPFAVSIAKPGGTAIKIIAQGLCRGPPVLLPVPQEVVVNIPPGYRVIDAPMPSAPREIPR